MSLLSIASLNVILLFLLRATKLLYPALKLRYFIRKDCADFAFGGEASNIKKRRLVFVILEMYILYNLTIYLSGNVVIIIEDYGSVIVIFSECSVLSILI